MSWEILALIVLAIALMVIAYLFNSHLHSKINSAVDRATTIPANTIPALRQDIANLSTQVATSTQALATHVTSTVAAAVDPLTPPKPPAAN
jgi:hypothetical protein